MPHCRQGRVGVRIRQLVGKPLAFNLHITYFQLYSGNLEREVLQNAEEDSGLLIRAAQILLSLIAVVLATRLGGLFGFPPTGISTFWPPNAILLAAILLLGERYRLTCVLLAYPAYVLAELWIGFGLGEALVFAAANCIAVAIGLQVVDWLGAATKGLTNLRQLFALFVATVTASIAGGLLGGGWFVFSGGEFGPTILRWSLADFVGYLVFAPVILTLPDWPAWWRKSSLPSKLEAGASTWLILALSIVAYGPLHLLGEDFRGAQFLPIPIMLWMALRFGPKGAAVSSLIVSFVALTYAINGFGPFSDLSPESNVASLQVFITSIVIATLLVAVLLRERDEALTLLSEWEHLKKEERYRALVDLATDAIMIFDVEAEKFIEANPRAARIFGCSVDDLLRFLGPSDLSPEFQPDGRRSDETARAYLIDALQGEFPTFEWTHRDCDGRDFPCEVKLARFPDPERQLVRASIIDLTDRKESERHRMELQSQLNQAQKLEAVGQMTGGVAHDFNNLLNVILGNLELLLDEVEDKEQIELIDAAIRATHKGADLTQNMLSFARRAYLQPAQLDLSGIVRDMDNWIARTIPASIRVEKSLRPDLWRVEADLSTTESAVLNLMINARDAMPDGGVITLETANVVLDEQEEGGIGDDLKPGHYALLAVSDTGVGIPAENLERVFDPFFTTKGPGEGSGLGLSMVHGFMKQSGGGARVYSEVGIGTTVKLYFPVSVPQEGEDADHARATSAPPAVAGRILIAEDQEAVIDLLVRILRSEGHEVVPSPSGDQALEIFRSDGSFDLLVTDIVMPGRLQGPELASELRKINPALPVVFMSGYAREATIHGNGLRESDIRLMKPVSKKDLTSSVQTALLSNQQD